MDKASVNLKALQTICNVNQDFKTLKDSLGILGNIFTQTFTTCNQEPLGAISKFAETVVDTVSIPEARAGSTRTRWRSHMPTLTPARRHYLLALGQTSNCAELTKMVTKDNTAIVTNVYKQIQELALVLVTKLETVSRSGKFFTSCTLNKNSHGSQTRHRPCQ